MGELKKLGILGVFWATLTGRKVFFLKCDEKGCPYIAWYPEPDLRLIDEPCPMCRSNLCTEGDMRAFLDRELSRDQ